MKTKQKNNNMKCTCVFTDKESGLGSQSMSSYFEIITEPLQTIIKNLFIQNKTIKPKNRITNTFTHKSRMCLTFLWNQNSKSKIPIYWSERGHTLQERQKYWVSSLKINKRFLIHFSEIWAESCIFYKTTLIKDLVDIPKQGLLDPKIWRKSCKYFVA